jgi:hypothetical protein
MLTLKASVAVAILAGTAAVSAGASCLVTRATMTAGVAVNCPQQPMAAVRAPSQPKPFPPLGSLPKTTGGQKF